jgi:hypothetical protein
MSDDVRFEGLRARVAKRVSHDDHCALRDEILALLGEDERAVELLVELGDPTAARLLRETMDSATRPMVRAFCAHGLYRLAGDASGVAVLIDLLGASEEQDRAAAAFLLVDLPFEVASGPLIDALIDGTPLVSGMALEALLRLTGLGELDRSRTTRLGLFFIRVGSRLRSVRAAAVADLVFAMELVGSGLPLAETGLTDRIPTEATWLPALEAALAQSDELELGLLRGLPGFEREYLEHALVSRLPDDLRVAEALAQLGATSALPALEETRDLAPPEQRARLDRVIYRLALR